MVRETPWIIKYSPKTVEEFADQKSALASISNFLKRHKRAGKPLLLAGPTGVGKTTAVYAVAKNLGYEIVEVNASDTRNKETIHSIVGSASTQGSIFFKKKLILIDEIDGLAGRADRGGIAELVRIIKKSPNPIILIANDMYSDKIKQLRKISNVLEMKPIPYDNIVKALQRIGKQEGLDSEKDVYERIASTVNGDMRAAVNDLQTITCNGRIEKEALEMLGERENQELLVNATIKVFKTKNPSVSLGSFDYVQENLDQVMMWIDENTAREYKSPEDIAKAYDTISLTDVFFGRIRRWQYYRFYVYIYQLLTAGISLAKKEKYKGFTKFKKPERPLTIWILNRANASRKSFSQKLAEHTHTSSKRAYKDAIFFKAACKENKEFLNTLSEHLDLDSPEKAWLVK